MNEHEIFAAAIRLTGAARAAFVEAACGGNQELRAGVEALLREHDESGGLLPRDAALLSATVDQSPASLGAGALLAGRYKLIQVLGEGGMGTVWLAEQQSPVKRRVAVKLIKPGMDSRAVLARFEAERQALAIMDHPHIARIFDGGMTDQGRPFFVMELVKGIPITQYCDQMQLSVPQRLELFGQVCSAVQHAHQKGIIHRDLKPSNILVCDLEGKLETKVIDFGLAKALHGSHALSEISMHTAFDAVVGTPLYMAPEQLGATALDIDTRADLYSLGVVLYELLTGTTPIEKSRLQHAAWEEIRRIVRDEDPPRPSNRLSSTDALPSISASRHSEPARLSRLVRGDLDSIVMKLLEKDRNRRYESSSALARDIERHLRGEVVEACPPSAAYRLRKFALRHRTMLSIAGLFVVTLIVAAGLSTYLAIWALQEQRRAVAHELEAIDGVRRFRDAVENNPELRDNPGLEALRKTLLREPLEFFQKLHARLRQDQATGSESLERLALVAHDMAELTSQIGDKRDAPNRKPACRGDSPRAGRPERRAGAANPGPVVAGPSREW